MKLSGKKKWLLLLFIALLVVTFMHGTIQYAYLVK